MCNIEEKHENKTIKNDSNRQKVQIWATTFRVQTMCDREQKFRWTHLHLFLNICAIVLGPLSGVSRMNHDRVMDILNRMIIEIDEALIKAKAQMEYLDDREIDLIKLGFEEAISGDMMRDE